MAPASSTTAASRYIRAPRETDVRPAETRSGTPLERHVVEQVVE